MVRKLLLLTFLFCCALYVTAQDDNVKINTRKISVSYDIDRKTGEAYVLETTKIEFESLIPATSALYASFYDNISMISKETLLNEKGKKLEAYSVCGNYVDGDIFYSDAKVCMYKLRFAMKGEKITLILEKKIKDLRYFTRLYLTEPYPISESILELRQPEWLNLQLKEFNFSSFKILKSSDKQKGNLIHTFKAENLPAMKKEPYAEGSSYVYPHLLLLHKSYTYKQKEKEVIASLDGLYAWYKYLVKEIKDEPEKVAQFSKNLTAKCVSDSEKIKEIYYWTQYNIRYIAFEEGIAGFQPESAAKVLNQRFGDCKGKANLMKSMLQAQGFDARLAWVGTSQLVYDYTTPSLAVDNHMVCVLLHNKDTLVLDATEPYLALGDFAERLQGRQLLVENNEGYFIYKTPVLSANRNAVHHEVSLTLAGENLEGLAKSRFSGESKAGLLYMCNGVSSEATDKFLINHLKSLNNQLLVSKVSYSSLHERERPFEVNYSLDVKQALKEFNGSWYLQLPLFQYKSLIEVDADRLSAVNLNEKVEYTEEYSITIPAGMHVSYLPQPAQYSYDDFNMSLTYTQVGDRIQIRKEMYVPSGKIQKGSFDKWNTSIAQMRKRMKEQIILAKE